MNDAKQGADVKSVGSNDLLGDNKYETQMTNEELQRAIAAAWDTQNRTGRISDCHTAVVSHLEALLRIQQMRAGFVRLRSPNAEVSRDER